MRVVVTSASATNTSPLSLKDINDKTLIEREIKDRALAQTKNYGLLFKLTELATGANGMLANSPSPEWSLGEEPSDLLTVTAGALDFSGAVNSDVTSVPITNYGQLHVGQLVHIYSYTTATPANAVEIIGKITALDTTSTIKILSKRTTGSVATTYANVFGANNTTVAKILPATLGFNEVIPYGKFFNGKWIKNFMQRMHFVIQEGTGTKQFINMQDLSKTEQMRLAWKYFMQKYSNHLYTNNIAIGQGIVLGAGTSVTGFNDAGITGGYDYFLRPDNGVMKDTAGNDITDCKGFREIVAGNTIGMEDLENLCAKAYQKTTGGEKILVTGTTLAKKILQALRDENVKVATEQLVLPKYPDISMEVMPIYTGFGKLNLLVDYSADGINKIITDGTNVSKGKSWGYVLDTNAIGFLTLNSARKFGGGVQDLRFLDVPANELGNQQDITVLECTKSLYIKDPTTCGYLSTTVD